jgi:Zn-finger nucleic acid-binding protein
VKCPNCENHLVSLELADVEVDYCFTCKGIWLDKGELENLIRLEDGEDDLLKSAAKTRTAEKKRKCPACRKSMEKILAGKVAPVLLDRCLVHGIWFDSGELRKILSFSCKEEISSPVVRLLDDMFAAQKGGCT